MGSNFPAKSSVVAQVSLSLRGALEQHTLAPRPGSQTNKANKPGSSAQGCNCVLHPAPNGAADIRAYLEEGQRVEMYFCFSASSNSTVPLLRRM